MDKKEKISVKGLFKIFGEKPEAALKMLGNGSSKEEILTETGMTIGVQDADFCIYEGEIFVVMGLSGSGKSTLVRMLNRLIETTAGNIFLDGADITSMSPDELKTIRRKKISMVFQSFALMPHLSVIENAAFGLEMTGLKKIEREALALAALEQVGLEKWAFSMPDELSGGMKQRVGLARALAVNPDVLLMDEAFSALDPLIRAEMQDELIKLQKKNKRTIVFISHDLDEAMRIGDRIAIMEGGRIVQVGTPEDILQNPADDYVRAFFRGVDPTVILTAKDIAVKHQVTIKIKPGNGPRTALQRLIQHERDYIYVIDENGIFKGVLQRDELIEMADAGEKEIRENHLKPYASAFGSDSMQDVLPLLIDNPYPIPVTDTDGTYLGTVSKNIFLKTLHKGGQA